MTSPSEKPRRGKRPLVQMELAELPGEESWRNTYGDMSYLEANVAAVDIEQRWPSLKADVVPLTESLSFVTVEGPTTRGVVQLTLHDRRELAEFIQLMEGS